MMSKYNSSSEAINKMRYTKIVNTMNDTAIVSIHKKEIPELLEMLTMSKDTEVLSKLFSVLAAYLVTKKAKIEYIVRCRPLYDKVQDMLARGSPYMTHNILNFLTALFSLDNENENWRGMVLHAQNLVRVSGCLLAMCHVFTGCVMYQDTWIALIHCLSEACRGCEINQSYCAHLVPICVKKCDTENIEVCLLLQSLINNHNRNIQLFLKSNGLNVFTRETLQVDSCMQLLNSLIQNSPESIILLRESTVVDILRHFLRTHGSQSRIGQWSKITLFHLDLRDEEITKMHTFSAEQQVQNIENSVTQELENTANLFQNIIKEVINWKTYSTEGKFKSPFPLNGKNFHFKPCYIDSLPQKITQQKSLQNCTYVKSCSGKDLSFSFLNKLNITSNNSEIQINETHGSQLDIKVCHTNALRYNCTSERYNSVSCQTYRLLNTHETKVGTSISDFIPAFASTPKQQQDTTKNQNTAENSYKIRNLKKKKLARKIYKVYKYRKRRNETPRKEIKNQSLSSRFFSAINESCTTLVKSVKNIFKAKEKESLDNEANNLKEVDDLRACDYSFTNYMRIRDAILTKESKIGDIDLDEISDDINKVNSCKTCNDTTVLKQKLAEDEYLKQTMKKLKLGINLYGCDFKKIARAMWPRDAYMTPNVLYNLYRKLIVK